MPNAQSKNHEVGTRLQALALIEAGVAQKTVTAITGISRTTIKRLQEKAKERGYDPNVSKELKLDYVTDQSRPGRPRGITRTTTERLQEMAKEPGCDPNVSKD